MRNDTPTEIAAAALTELNDRHAAFMQAVAGLKNKGVNGGIVESDGKNLSVVCLGVSFTVSPRPIVRDGFLSELEYPFFAQIRGQEHLIWRMYLNADDGLYADPDLKTRICDSTNTHLPEHLIEHLASALLQSPVFQPLK